ncbi:MULTISPECIES: flavin monoamine oxidase family protein [Clostridium]|jgi:monoamine oxidase|uniref:flavin monoamine oxidase family protein n=1 Tax=Clostridium TaxID=1485 RepID=UPI000BE3E7A7|nr:MULTISPECIES: NAD(P)/FAD-dependent oxidoreductase [Clostridium]MBS6501457.1 FAD-dependent oxidoreductase [Clostridium sp.]MDU1277634.1 NAD(P)/FAD-dependent oxidoreductase [Clostridium sp.]MDU1568486.1 NAD(P)/FAD-dependent oxidoreductase [Clostridium sp.]MDU2460109.1 NAD(P)/FAD-dependent oxidoreductase [Clostridium sp.]MDU3525851.1 NAD(P)/FAD-dependent oxidoreductase [Clostridium sp.]
MESWNNLKYVYQVDNPSDDERYNMLEYILKDQKRVDDINNIVELMSPPTDITNICQSGYGKDIKVAIIGAGEAGLAAAVELRKIGCDITLFEASQRIGGKVYTYYFDRKNNKYGELGEISIPVSHYTTWHYINLFNLETRPFVNNNNNSLLYIRGAKALNDQKGKQVVKNIHPKFDLSNSDKKKLKEQVDKKFYKKYLEFLTLEERRELLEIKDKYSEKIEQIDKLSYRKAYENAGFSEEAISMLGYLDGSKQFFQIGLMEILQRYYTVDSEFNYYIKDGMINLPLSLYGALFDENEKIFNGIDKEKLGNVKAKMGTPVEGIYSSETEDRITIKYAEGEMKKEVLEKFDYVICTIPFQSLRRMDIEPNFNSRKIRAINEMNYETSGKIYLYLKERFWEMGGKSKGIVGGKTFTDIPLVSIYYPSDHSEALNDKIGSYILKPGASPKESGVLLVSYSWCNEAMLLGNENAELQIRDAIRYIEKIHNLPLHYIDDNLIDYKSLIWSDVQYIWGAGALSKPEDKILFSYGAKMPEMNNRVFFAGEHISQKHGTQQGSLQSGMIAANEVAERIMINNKI